MSISDHEVHIQRLSIMLEGQVAALDAQVLRPDEAASLVNSMYASPLYREDQKTFLLYPDKTLSDFEARNCVSAASAMHIGAVRQWIESNDTRIMAADLTGTLHFNADLKNAEVLDDRLNELEPEPDWTPISDADRVALLDLYERTFNHSAFTGRSASMYGYEGLGCVYWHMVAKLLVAVQESHHRAVAEGSGDVGAVADAYRRVRDGFGFNKTPAEYGAFPIDAYSHTPGHSGAQQPGMTGQVKEQVLTRFGELGVRVRSGCLCFEPALLEKRELLSSPVDWSFTDATGRVRTVRIEARGLGFTLAGVPVVYRTTDDGSTEQVRVVRTHGPPAQFDGLQIDPAHTREVLSRAGAIERIEVDIAASRLS